MRIRYGKLSVYAFVAEVAMLVVTMAFGCG